MKNPARTMLVIARVLLGVALFWIVAKKTEAWNLAFPALASPAIFLPVVAFSLVGAMIEAARFVALLRAQGAAVGFGDSFRLATAAFSLNFCIPGGAAGDLSKLYYLRDAHGGKGWELATVIFVDRLVGMLSMLLLVAMLGVACWPIVRSSAFFLALLSFVVAVMAAIMTFAALCLSTAPLLRKGLGRLIAVMPLRLHLQRIAESLFRFGDHRGALVRALLLSFAGHLAAAAVFSMIGWKLYPSAPLPAPAFLSLLGLFANVITITPGGLGVGEAAFGMLFAEAGLQGGAAIMIIWRIGMVPICLLGLLYYMAGLRPKPA